MGRRRRNNSDDDDDDDDDNDALEREWLKKRQKSEVKEGSDPSSKGETNKPKKEASAPAPAPAPATTKDDANNDVNKIERMRLKKQLKKQRQKAKKAEAKKKAEESTQKKEKEKKMQKEQVAKKNEKKQFNESKKQSNEFKSLRKGVKYLDLKVGAGPVVQHRKKIRVAYTLRAKNHTNGKIIDASKNFGFRLGKGEVIEGYDIGLEGMRVGGIRRLVVPKQAGYHNDDIGAGRGADLFFEIELIYAAP